MAALESVATVTQRAFDAILPPQPERMNACPTAPMSEEMYFSLPVATQVPETTTSETNPATSAVPAPSQQQGTMPSTVMHPMYEHHDDSHVHDVDWVVCSGNR